MIIIIELCVSNDNKEQGSCVLPTPAAGVACHAGAEKVAHALRRCIEVHWMNKDFIML